MLSDGLHVGNCADLMTEIDDNAIDLTITSPPYNDLRDYNGYTFDFEAIARQLYRLTKQGGVVVWVVADKTKDGDESGTSFRQALYFKEIGFKLFDTMIYLKKSPTITGFKGYFQCFEYMFVVSKGEPKTINPLMDRPNKHISKNKIIPNRLVNGQLKKRKMKDSQPYGKRWNVWEYATGSVHSSKDKIAFQHPAIFPEKLAEDHILSWSNPDDLVFDPMCGSGTVGKIALIHRRRFIGMDISAEYIEIAKERTSGLTVNMF